MFDGRARRIAQHDELAIACGRRGEIEAAANREIVDAQATCGEPCSPVTFERRKVGAPVVAPPFFDPERKRKP